MITAEPLFDSTRAALRFALNHHMALPRPAMNKMMADGKVMRITLADGSKITVAQPRGRPRNEQLKGLDGAGTAGMILARLAGLPEPHQLTLMAGSMPAYLPCACGAPCCAREKVNPEWSRAIGKLCDHLRDEAELTKIKGKKGLSTSPVMRRALVEKFFIPKRHIVLEDLARVCGVSEQTVVAHRKPILAYLEKAESQGWRALDVDLSEIGIVGFIG